MSNCKRSDAAVAYATIASGAPALLVGVAWGWGSVAGLAGHLSYAAVLHDRLRTSLERLGLDAALAYLQWWYRSTPGIVAVVTVVVAARSEAWVHRYVLHSRQRDPFWRHVEAMAYAHAVHHQCRSATPTTHSWERVALSTSRDGDGIFSVGAAVVYVAAHLLHGPIGTVFVLLWWWGAAFPGLGLRWLNLTSVLLPLAVQLVHPSFHATDATDATRRLLGACRRHHHRHHQHPATRFEGLPYSSWWVEGPGVTT